jgi:two-component system, NarL family, response regulator NreC
MRLPRIASRLAWRVRHPAPTFGRSWSTPVPAPRAAALDLVPGPSGPRPDSSPDDSARSREGIRVMLVDDHVIVRSGVRTLLEEKHHFEVVAEAREGIEALDLLGRVSPRVAVMDLIMPGLGGLETTRQIHERFPATEVIILSAYCDEDQVALALAAGARGFVRKDAEVGRLADAIRNVVEGRLDFGDVIAADRLTLLLANPPALGRYESLTRREKEVLHLTAWGYSCGRIAEQLAISPRTVETHRAHLLHKLGMRNHVELVYFAIRHGVLTPDSAEALRARERTSH